MANKEKNDKLAKPVTAAPPATRGGLDVPDYLRPAQGGPAGGENVDGMDVLVPRLALCQSMTPQRKKSDPKHIPGLNEGMFFNNISGKIYGEKVRVVPAFFYKSRIRFLPMDDGGGILCQAPDGKIGAGDPGGECARCPYAMFGKDGEAPGCTEFKNFASIIVPDKGLPSLEDAIVVSFKSTGLKAAKTWNTLLRMRGLDYFASIFDITSAEQKNDKGTFFVPVISFAADRTDCSTSDKTKAPSLVSQEMHRIGHEVYEGMKALQLAGKLRVNLEDQQAEVDATDTSTKEM